MNSHPFARHPREVFTRIRMILVAIPVLLTSPVASAEERSTLRPWTEYRTIMWIGDSVYKKPEKLPLFLQRLREMGINTGMVHHGGDPGPFIENKFPYYVENLANRGLCLKWNSPVRDWESHVTAWAKTRDAAGLKRPYSLDDPEWRAQARKDVQAIVRKNRAHTPLAYDLRDELSTTISANPFDYDFSPTALRGFHRWLKDRYGALDELNAQWDTAFPRWEDVLPFTTDQIKNRMAGGVAGRDHLPAGKADWQALQKLKFDPARAREAPKRWNFSPWTDHRSYMDASLAATLGDLREAVRELDPHTPVGIEGTQMPAAFGGYDLWRLSQVLDWVEPYDIGNAREIFGSFMPGKPILTTVGEQDARAAQRRLWHLLLAGDKGCIIWWSEDCIDWGSDDYALTPRARALAPVLQEMTSPLAQLFLRAERETDPIAIHYSQASIQVNWLLESTVDGSTWLRRFSSYEATHNRMARRRQAWVKLLGDAGYTPRFVSSMQIENGELQRGKYRALILPESLAVSDAESEQIQAFLHADKTERFLCWSGPCGEFDEHGRLRERRALGPLLDAGSEPDVIEAEHESFVRSSSVPSDSKSVNGVDGDVAGYLVERKTGKPEDAVSSWAEWVARELGRMPPEVRVPASACCAVSRYRLGPARLLAFERNIVWQMGEDLKQAGGNEALEKSVAFEAKLAAPGHVYDLRTGKYLGHTAQIPVDLDPWRPCRRC